MKKILKSVLPAYLISTLRILFPSRVQKDLTLRENQEIKRRADFYATFIKQNELCFDVGANTGNRIGPLLAIGAKVVAVEPQEECYVYLIKKFGRKIDVIPKGLGEAAGRKEFYISSGSPLSSFSKEWINAVKDERFKDYSWGKPKEVEMTTLDELILQFGVPAFIKIDVEGYELEVLKGLTKPVKMISFEYTVPEQKLHPILCIEQIENNDKNIECNYSIGESMVFAKNKWLTSTEMKEHLLSDEFIRTGFGDVYVRMEI